MAINELALTRLVGPKAAETSQSLLKSLNGKLDHEIIDRNRQSIAIFPRLICK